MIASHYLDAHAADPEASDRDEVRAEARRWFTRAAERAASMAASMEAQRAFERAADLTDEAPERGRSLARAGDVAALGGRLDEAVTLLEAAIDILVESGDRGDAARAEVRLGDVLLLNGRIEEGVSRLESALSTHDAEGDESAIATVCAQLGRLLFFEGRRDEAIPYVERALELAERLRLAEVVVEALINKGLILQRRPNESLGLMRQALVLAEEAGVDRGALRACMNLSYLLALAGRTDEAVEAVEHGIALARRRGDRVAERGLTTNLMSSYFATGRWDDVQRAFDELPEEGRIVSQPVQASAILDLAQIALYRGETEHVRELAGEFAAWHDTTSFQALGVGVWARVLVAQAEGRHADALAACLDALGDTERVADAVFVEGVLVGGGESATALGSADELEQLLRLASEAPINPTPSLEAHVAHQQARLAVLRGNPEPPFESAVAALRDIGEPFWVATALLEQAEHLAANGRGDETGALAAEAREVFERLRVAPALERLDALAARRRAGGRGALSVSPARTSSRRRCARPARRGGVRRGTCGRSRRPAPAGAAPRARPPLRSAPARRGRAARRRPRQRGGEGGAGDRGVVGEQRPDLQPARHGGRRRSRGCARRRRQRRATPGGSQRRGTRRARPGRRAVEHEQRLARNLRDVRQTARRGTAAASLVADVAPHELEPGARVVALAREDAVSPRSRRRRGDRRLQARSP